MCRIAEEALGLGKSVVTANKAMLALHGPRLASLAEENNATIGALASALRENCRELQVFV